MLAQVGHTQAARAIIRAIGLLDKYLDLAGPLMHYMYDVDVLTEEQVLNWYQTSSAEGNTVAATDFITQFVHWLRTAESESESDDDAVQCKLCK